MAKKIINIGSSANAGNGDPLRLAFGKINDNFTEIYNNLGLDGTIFNPLSVDSNLIPSTTLTYDLGSPTKQWKSLYVGTHTIYINNIPLSLDNGGNLTVNDLPVASQIDYTLIPNAPTDIADFTDNSNLLGQGGGGSSDRLIKGEYEAVLDVAGDLTVPNFIKFWDSSVQETAYRYTAAATAPTITTGALWFNTSEGKLYVNYNQNWVDANPTEIDPDAIRFNNLNQIELPEGGDIVDFNGISVLGGGGNPFDQSLNQSDDVTFATISFPTSGLGAPTVSTRSAGTKLVIWPEVNISGHADYAIGMADSVLWQTVPTTGQSFKWYGGDTLAMTLSGAGILNLPSGGDFRINGQSIVGGATDRITVGGKTLSIDTNGVLSFPNNNTLDTGGPAFKIQSQNSITVSPNGNNFVFESNGYLTLPSSGGQSAILSSDMISVGPNSSHSDFFFNLDNTGLRIGGGNPNNGLSYHYSTESGTPINTLMTTRSGNLSEFRIISDGTSGGVIKLEATGQNGFITLTSSGRVWNFGSDGKLEIPVSVTSTGVIKSASSIWFDANGKQLKLNSGGAVDFPLVNDTTALLRTSGNLTLNANGKEWLFDTTGKITAPGEIWTKAGDGIQGLTFSPDGSTSSAYIKVDGGQNALFQANGNIYIRQSGSDRLAISNTNTTLSATNNVRLAAGGSSKVWTFGNNGIVSLPQSLGSGNNAIYKDSEYVDGVNAGIKDLWIIYQESEAGWMDTWNWDSVGIDVTTRPWYGVPSYLALQILQNNWEQQQLPDGVFSTPAITSAYYNQMRTAAAAAAANYTAWQNIVSTIEIKSANKTWSFGSDGILILPTGGDIVDGSSVSVLTAKEPKFEMIGSGVLFSAQSGKRYGINTTNGSVSAVLPLHPELGDAIFFVDSHGTFSTHNLIIDGYGKNIAGNASITISTNNENVGLFYNGTEWRYYA